MKNKISERPILLQGGVSKDKMGSVSFVNEFKFSGIKRFYVIKSLRKGMVRAWHGHKHEEKYVYVISGKALVGAVEIDNWINPSKEAKIYNYKISSEKPAILHIPGGYANGFKSLSSNTKLIFFSTNTLEQSKKDDIRFNAKYWNIWDVSE